jgi:hypothetical protein
MLRRSSGSLLLAGLWATAALGSAGCSSEESVVLQERGSTGSVQLALSVRELKTDSVSAVLSRSGDDRFEPQTQTFDLRGGQGVISVFFGDLPVGRGYTLELRAGACSGSASFSIQADTTTVVDVGLSCGAAAPTGSAQINGSIDAGARACDLITQIVAAPSIQRGNGAPSRVEVVLRPGVSALAVGWVVSSDSSARVALNVDPGSRTIASVDCQSSGSAELVATVQALSSGTSCTEQARARIECLDQAQPVPPAAADAGAAPGAGRGSGDAGIACSSCTRDFCGAKQQAVSAQLAAVAPILACVVGADWQGAARATSSSCANADLIGCYCGSVAPAVCSVTAPSALDGQCRDLLLAGSGCSDSACLQTNLLKPQTATGDALLYVRCQQDFCYDLCFNP